MKINIKKNKRGVSLIELMVAIAIFSVLILSATQIFKMVADGQRSAISAQNTQENIRYAMEKISKEIRMARISNHDCESIFSPPPAAIYKVYNTSGSGSKLYFKNKNSDCVAYYLENSRLKITVGTAPAITNYITPAKIEVSNLKFFAVDDLIGAFHNVQPYVTIVMDVRAVGPAIHEQKMKIQLTVSSRYYE